LNAIEVRRAQRFLYLRRLYEKANGSLQAHFVFTEVGRELGWDDSISNDVTEYLSKQGLIEFPSFSTVSLTLPGLMAIEQALTNTSEPTRCHAAGRSTPKY
jgi:hypothetical protein